MEVVSMKYIMLLWVGKDASDGGEEDLKAWSDFENEAKQASVLVLGTALQPAQQASKLVWPKLAQPLNGEEIKAGTFTNGAKQIEGFYIIDCENESDALKWAQKLPTRGTVEVRPFLEYDLS